jgi:hypothetical protein
MSVGMLAIIITLLQNQASHHSGWQHQQALMLAADLGEPLGLLPTDVLMPASSPKATVSCNAAPCTPGQMHSYLYTHWQQRVEKSLPESTGSYRIINSTRGPVAEVTVLWQGRDGPAKLTSQYPLGALSINDQKYAPEV